MAPLQPERPFESSGATGTVVRLTRGAVLQHVPVPADASRQGRISI
jgi:hypothetical protein